MRKVFLLLCGLLPGLMLFAQNLYVAPGDTLTWADLPPTIDSLVVAGTCRLESDSLRTLILRHGIRVARGGVFTALRLRVRPPAEGQVKTLLQAAQTATVHLTETEITGYRPRVALAHFRGADVRLSACRLRTNWGNLLVADESPITITGSTLSATDGNTIQLASAGIGAGSRIVDNDISVVVTRAHPPIRARPQVPGEVSLDTPVALLSYHPLQTITGNRITVNGAATGLHFARLEAYANYPWSGAELTLRNNVISQLSDEPMGTGMIFADFPKLGNRDVRNGDITGFRTGLITATSSLNLTGFTLTDNRVSVDNRGSYLRDFSIRGGTTGVRYAAPEGTIVRVRGLQLTGLHQGILAQAPLRGAHFLADVRATEVHHPLVLSPTMDARLHLTTTDWLDAHNHNNATPKHQHHHDRPASTAVDLVPEQALRATPEDRTLPHSPGWRICPSETGGRLTVATGFGLSDPVHEHTTLFSGYTISDTIKTRTRSLSGQDFTVGLAAENNYRLTVDTEAPVYDLSLRWEGERPVRLTVPYPHADPFLLRALGKELAAVANPDDLRDTDVSAWYYDGAAKEIHLHLVPHTGLTEVVLYARRVTTSIEVEGQAVAVTVLPTAGGLRLAYTLPATTASKLVLTDHFGTPVSRFTPNSAAPLDISWQDLPPSGGWYFLSVGGQMFKGPLP